MRVGPTISSLKPRTWRLRGRNALLASLSGAALLAAPAPAQARAVDLPDSLELGRDGNGDPCTATRFYRDSTVPDDFAVRYSVTCRGAAESRFLGIARAIQLSDAAKLDAVLDCSAASETALPGFGLARSRQCYDKQLGTKTVETRVQARGRLFAVSIVPAAQGPGEELMRIIARVSKPNADRGRKVEPVVQIKGLADAPAGAASAMASAADARVALDQGLRFIRTGLYTESSRVLNNALSRLSTDTPVETRIELLMAVGLADSNLRYFASAKSDFEQAKALLIGNTGLPAAGSLTRKLRAYVALDQLNQRQFSQVSTASLAAASDPTSADPLMDPATLRALNQSAAGAGNATDSVVNSPDIAALDQLLIDTQASWARSVALLGENKPEEARAALQAADQSLAALRAQRIDPSAFVYIDSRIERQRYKLLLREGKRDEAIAALDKAIAILKQAESSGTVGPTLAQAQIERADAAARAGAPRAAVLIQFNAAVDTLIAADASAIELPPAIEDYLDLLVADARTNPTGSSPARFFRALQAVGDPAIARSFAQLRSSVTADPKMAAKIKDKLDYEREINRLSNQINTGSDSASAKSFEAQRSELENKLLAVRNELQANNAYNAVDDTPATIEDVQKVLRPGEAYYKLSGVRRFAFGILIDTNGAQIFRVAQPLATLKSLSAKLRSTIDGDGTSANLPAFGVGPASALFQLITGPVGDRMLAANALIVDGSGPLEELPIGVLVTNKDSVTRYIQSLKTAPGERYSKVDFLARRLSISNALSPRSLIVSRHSVESAAPYPFIGFAEHAPVPTDVVIGDKFVSIGNGCSVDIEAIAASLRSTNPIPARELDEATDALGVKDAPKLTRLDFTDTAIKARTDLYKFQVLHFATHGVNEGVYGCDGRSPPGLVTSLGGKGSVALLSFDDISRLKLDANLVVLSACETASKIGEASNLAAGQGREGGSNNASLEGLVRAVLTANARAVLATYWPISNAGESEQLISAFYGAARQGTIGDALKTAQAELIANPDSSHPYFWGAFFLVGDAQKPLLTGAARAQMVQKSDAPSTAPAGKQAVR
ncbi:CHAT domain-containing protein [Novosphingobium sp.]|uniref:CHAT domain-containing protein n=1 Tax=Novosphingobium sp. TaxID=1874826 RepID=UPI0025EC05D5|nr:CHAT domain-containing protein [Novosphingobium sp.]